MAPDQHPKWAEAKALPSKDMATVKELSGYGLESTNSEVNTWTGERTNQTLLDKIKKRCKFGRNDWDRYVSKAVLAISSPLQEYSRFF